MVAFEKEVNADVLCNRMSQIFTKCQLDFSTSFRRKRFKNHAVYWAI